MRVVIEVPRSSGQLRVIRRFVEAWSATVAGPVRDLPLVATELVSNALNASPEDGSVILRLECEDGQMRIVVVDEGPGFSLSRPELPAPTAVRGRGLALAAAVVDDLAVERIDGLTVVTATRYLDRQ